MEALNVAARVLVTGSTMGLGRATADALLSAGHTPIVHARDRTRGRALSDLVDRGALLTIADLADIDQTVALADHVNAHGGADVVIHNAGVASGPWVAEVNVVAPYALTARLRGPQRWIFVSSSMHRGGSPERVSQLADPQGTTTYSDSKLYVTTLAAAIARIWPDVGSNAVDPGWVPTRMGGDQAPDDLGLGHQTQVWLALADDDRARTSGGYWYHGERRRPHRAVLDARFQDVLLETLARRSGIPLPNHRREGE